MQLGPLLLDKRCMLQSQYVYLIQLINLLQSFILRFYEVNPKFFCSFKGFYFKFNQKNVFFPKNKMIWGTANNVTPCHSVSPQGFWKFSFIVPMICGYCFCKNHLQNFISAFHLPVFLGVVWRCNLMFDMIILKGGSDFMSYKLGSSIYYYFSW